MVSGRKKKSKASALTAPVSLQLADFRTVFTQFERFLRPDEAPKGTFDTDSGATIQIVSSKAGERVPSQRVLLNVLMNLEGYRLVGDGQDQKRDQRSFSIKVVCEAAYVVVAGRLDETVGPEQLDIEALLREVNPLVVSKIRDYASDLGFRAVRPRLGFHPKLNLDVTTVHAENAKAALDNVLQQVKAGKRETASK